MKFLFLIFITILVSSIAGFSITFLVKQATMPKTNMLQIVTDGWLFAQNILESNDFSDLILQELSKMKVCNDKVKGEEFERFQNGFNELLSLEPYTLLDSTLPKCVDKKNFPQMLSKSYFDVNHAEFNAKFINSDSIEIPKIQNLIISSINSAKSEKNTTIALKKIASLLGIYCQNLQQDCLTQINNALFLRGGPSIIINK